MQHNIHTLNTLSKCTQESREICLQQSTIDIVSLIERTTRLGKTKTTMERQRPFWDSKERALDLVLQCWRW